MAPSYPALRVPPIGFAHRGARAHAPENTIEAFALARRLGATGLESDVWCTADGVAVLDHDGVVGTRMRRRQITEVPRAALPSHIPALADLYAECGTDFELSLDVKDPAAARATVAVARAAGGDAPGRLWLCHHDWQQLVEWRPAFPDVRLVDSTRLRFMRSGAERRAAQLADAGIDAVNLHESDWTAGLTTLFHRFNVLTFGWDAQFERVLDNLLGMGMDAVYSDHVDRMTEALARASRSDPA
ncbi:MAG: glycerophosphoryl diester phosphodiesterase [Acidimicrobiaceae bacterium]|jgi:glycerophosphoryl diester phosphodiesterase